MKGVAKCDKHFELQNSANQQRLERTLRSRDIPDSTPASVSTAFTPSYAVFSFGMDVLLRVFVCQRASCLRRKQ